MGRLIDADELKKYFSLTLHGREVYNAEEILMTIQAMPTVDAVEVVRCKDCVFCKRFNDVWYLPKRDELLCTRYVETYGTTENDFCSWGERREDETD